MELATIHSIIKSTSQIGYYNKQFDILFSFIFRKVLDKRGKASDSIENNSAKNLFSATENVANVGDTQLEQMSFTGNIWIVQAWSNSFS